MTHWHKWAAQNAALPKQGAGDIGLPFFVASVQLNAATIGIGCL